ncbi:MAG: hopanoid biosynthesis associated RND transporter like protein HpnN [Gammaproteobacteria bacterium]
MPEVGVFLIESFYLMMLEKLRQLFGRALLIWINIVQRHKIITIILCFITVLIAVDYTRNNLGMNTDTEDMLSPDLDWRKLDKELSAEFPQFSSNILVVIEAPTPDQAMDAADRLYAKLEQEKTLLKSVFSFRALPFFKKSSLLFLEDDELQDVADRLAEIQPFLSRLTEDQNIRGLFTMLEEAIRAKLDGETVELSPLIKQINQSLDAVVAKQPFQLSWHSLMAGEALDKDIYREFIILQPDLDYSDLFPAETVIEKIRTLGDELEINAENDLRLRLSGSVVLSHEELQSVMEGTQLSVILALCMVTVIMIVGLGSFWLVLATIITLISGLIITAGWATLTVGELNLISVAFAVLYIGLGVDFAIHYCLRFREYFLNSNDRDLALHETSKSCGSSLFLCAVTTAIGFYAFMPTDYDGIAELGWISGSGMFISFIVTMTLLPALLGLFPVPTKSLVESNSHSNINKPDNSFLAFPVTYAKTIKIVSIIIAIVLIWIVPKVKFDHNTLNLQNPENESVKTYMDLLADSESSPWTSEILVNNEIEAEALAAQLKELPLVDDVTWLNKFIPEDQENKLFIIDDMDLILSGMNLNSSLPAPDIEDRITAINNLHLLMISKQNGLHQIPFSEDLLHRLETFMQRLSELDEEQKTNLLMKLEHSLLDSLPGRLESLNASLGAETVDEGSLPSALSSRWIGQNGKYLLEISPVENLQNNAALERFVAQVQVAAPNVIGSPIVSIEAGNAVMAAFKQAFLTAFIMITLLLLILMEKRRDAFLILIPILLAAMLTAGTSLLFSIPLNFANIIALPLLLGIGVDSGIHILHRYRTAPPKSGIILATSSARAVLVSALTTIVSIGNLAFSSHLGTASMGKLLTIGISMTLLCTLIILPSLLATTKTESSNKPS